jgi:hypothetical protein
VPALSRDGKTLDEDLPECGSTTDCLWETGTLVYKLTAGTHASTAARNLKVIVAEGLIEPR